MRQDHLPLKGEDEQGWAPGYEERRQARLERRALRREREYRSVTDRVREGKADDVIAAELKITLHRVRKIKGLAVSVGTESIFKARTMTRAKKERKEDGRN